MVNEIYYVGFPANEMMTNRKPVSFEVLSYDSEKNTLIIKLLENHPLYEGEKAEDFPKAGDEYTITNKLRGGGSLIDRLRSKSVAGFYTSRIGEESNHFSGTLFGCKPKENE